MYYNALIFLLVEKFDEVQALKTELSKKQQVHMHVNPITQSTCITLSIPGSIRKNSSSLRYGEKTSNKIVNRRTYLVLHSSQGLSGCNGECQGIG